MTECKCSSCPKLPLCCLEADVLGIEADKVRDDLGARSCINIAAHLWEKM